MSIKVIKENDCFRILEVKGGFQEGKPVQFFSEAELLEIQKERAFALELQMPSFIRKDDYESAEELF